MPDLSEEEKETIRARIHEMADEAIGQLFSATGPEFNDDTEPEDGSIEMWMPGYKLEAEGEFFSEEEALFVDEELAQMFAKNRYQDDLRGNVPKFAYAQKVRVYFNR